MHKGDFFASLRLNLKSKNKYSVVTINIIDSSESNVITTKHATG